MDDRLIVVGQREESDARIAMQAPYEAHVRRLVRAVSEGSFIEISSVRKSFPARVGADVAVLSGIDL